MPRKKQVSDPNVTTALATVEPSAVPAPVKVQAFSAITIQEAVGRLENVRRFITKALNQGYQRELKKLKGRKPNKNEEKALKALEIDYGSIPGVNKKFLLQPGAEKICLWLRVRPKYETVVTPVPENPGHIEVDSRVVLYAVGTGEEIFSGPLASCSSMESNFRYRWVKIDQTISAKKEWRDTIGFPGKKLGTHQCYPVWENGVKTGDWEWKERHENPNIWDERNKVRQMAEKRALVKAVRNFGALSEIFTEDPSEWKLDDESNVPAGDEAQAGQMGRVVRTTNDVGVGVKSEAVPAGPKEAVDSSVEPGIVEVHFPADNQDVALIVRMPAAFLEVITDIAFKNDVRNCYVVPAPDAAEVQARAEARGFKYVEVIQKEKPEPVKNPNARMPPKGMVTNVRMSDGNMSVLYAGVWCYCYHKPLFEHLAKARGQECEFIFAASPMPKIEGIKRIGNQEWDVESGLPIIQQKDR